MLKHLVLSVVLSALVLAGCHPQRNVLTGPDICAQTRDTLYVHEIEHDSVYIDNWQLVEHRADTVFVEKLRTEYRYQLKRDTVRVVRVDSIPVVREVYLPPKQADRGGPSQWRLALNLLGVLALIFFVVKLKKQLV